MYIATVYRKCRVYTWNCNELQQWYEYGSFMRLNKGTKWRDVILQCQTTHFSEIRGAFKKRPNFLNSAPISIESALRLLSAPSVRFWQQTVICPVSLWALVVELHPLNWARAQAVRRIVQFVVKEDTTQRFFRNWRSHMSLHSTTVSRQFSLWFSTHLNFWRLMSTIVVVPHR